jgi:C-terminal processing protease CtpA/Prc
MIRWHVLLTYFLLVVAGRTFAETTSEDVRPRKLKEKIVLRQPYRLGEDAAVRLELGQAVQFDVAENPYWLRECIVYPSKSGWVWLGTLDRDGYPIRGMDRRSLQEKFMLLTLAETPCLLVLRWETQAEAMVLHFQVSTSLQKNLGYCRQLRPEVNPVHLAGMRAFPTVQLPETERIAGFVRLWSEVKYNFVGFDRLPELKWDEVLNEYLPKVQQVKTADEYFCVLARCLALLHDGHSDISWGGQAPHPNSGGSRLPMEIRIEDDDLVEIVRPMSVTEIVGEARKTELLQANLKPGEELTQLDGRAVKDILCQDIYPYVSASTPQDRRLRAARWLVAGDYGSLARVGVKGLDGEQREVVLTRKPHAFDAHCLPRAEFENNFECRDLPKGLLYINLPSFESDQVVRDFQRVFSRVVNSKGLILDVRKNSGGDSSQGEAIIGLLTDKPVANTRWKTRDYRPAFRAWGRKEQYYEEDGGFIPPITSQPFLGPLVVLTGPATFSAAEDFVVPLHASKRATIVGERTAGSTRQPLWIELPCGAQARVCTKLDTYPDGRDYVSVGIIPDVEVHPTAADLAAGRDVALETAQRVICSR